MRDRLGNSSDLDDRLPFFTPEEIENNVGTSDFFGLNHYTTYLNRHKKTGSGFSDTTCSNWPHSGSDWLRPVPWGFRHLLRYIKRRYSDLWL